MKMLQHECKRLSYRTNDSEAACVVLGVLGHKQLASAESLVVYLVNHEHEHSLS